jgi:hypothetical protein
MERPNKDAGVRRAEKRARLTHTSGDRIMHKQRDPKYTHSFF